MNPEKQSLQELAQRETRKPGSLHRILTRLDPESARRIHSSDIQKLIRTMELRLLTQAPRPAQESAAPLTRVQRKAIVAATLGTIVEFTDWIIYATFAALFSRHFFPANDERTSLLSAFAVFAVGFVMRPVGAHRRDAKKLGELVKPDP